MKHVSCLIWRIIEESLFCLGSLKEKPVSLVLRFHANSDGSLTIYKSALRIEMRLIRIYIINKNLYYYYYYLLKQQRTKNLEQRKWNRIFL